MRTPEQSISAPGRVPQLDGLRGVAILLVLLWHGFLQDMGPWLQVLPPGLGRVILAAFNLTSTGVDLFFVLSGYLLGGILLDNTQSSRYFATFYLRRFFRILPVYYAFVVICVALSWLGFPYRDLLASYPLWSYLFFLQNFLMASANSFGNETVGVTWSLAIEEQFYLLLPFFIKRCRQSQVLWLSLLLVLVAPVTRIVMFFTCSNDLARFVLLPCRLDALMLGVLAAACMRRAGWRERVTRRPAILLLLALVVVGMGLLAQGVGLRTVSFTLVALVYACILLYVVTTSSGFLHAILAWGPLRYLGLISFTVYLFHQLCIHAVHQAIHGHAPDLSTLGDVGLTALSLGSVLLLATLSWYGFEKPILRFAHQFKY